MKQWRALQFAKNIMPPFFFEFIKIVIKGKPLERIQFLGDFEYWETAKLATSGYDSDLILKKVVNSARQVLAGEYAFERDGVCFKTPEFRYELLTFLLHSSNRNGALDVVDFGGSLGSQYFQHFKWLEKLDIRTWNVIEQDHFVKIGQSEFQNQTLKFFNEIEELPPSSNSALVLSSVLCYLENPWEQLQKLFSNRQFSGVFIDRTGISKTDRDHIKIQKIPKHIYDANYPCWFLSESKLKTILAKNGYEIFSSFDCQEPEHETGSFKSYFIFKTS